jgi:type I restriction enzyme M protein
LLKEEIKIEVEKLCNTFKEATISDAIDIVEHVAYFIFLRKLDKEDARKEKESLVFHIDYDGVFKDGKEFLRWSRVKNSNGNDIYELMTSKIRVFINDISNVDEYRYLRYIKDITLNINQDNIASFTKIIERIDKLLNNYEGMESQIYEYLVKKIPPIKEDGRFITPRHIIDMIIQLMEPKIDDTIMDAACGTGGFLVASSNYIKNNYESELHEKNNRNHFQSDLFNGLDSSTELSRIANINMILHGIDNGNIKCVNSLSESNSDRDKYTLIMSNIPFSGAIDKDEVSGDLAKIMKKSVNTQGLFTILNLQMLKLGGRCACIVPEGVVSSVQVFPNIREELVEKHKLEAVISMPSGMFKTNNKSGKESGAKASLLIFTKTGSGGTDKVWFYDMEADGYSLDDKRNKIEANDIPDIIHRFKNLDKEIDRERIEKSFLVDVEDIRQKTINNKGKKNYSLSIQEYKQNIYEELKYEDPKVMINNIEVLNKEIDIIIKEIKNMIGEI